MVSMRYENWKVVSCEQKVEAGSVVPRRLSNVHLHAIRADKTYGRFNSENPGTDSRCSRWPPVVSTAIAVCGRCAAASNGAAAIEIEIVVGTALISVRGVMDVNLPSSSA
jgi:hypothetical protein